MPSNNINLWCQSLGDHIISIKQLDLASFASCCSTSASAIFHARERKIKKPCSRQNWDKWQRNYSCNNFGWAVIKTHSLWRVQEMQVQSLRRRFNLSIRPSDPSIVPWISVVLWILNLIASVAVFERPSHPAKLKICYTWSGSWWTWRGHHLKSCSGLIRTLGTAGYRRFFTAVANAS